MIDGMAGDGGGDRSILTLILLNGRYLLTAVLGTTRVAGGGGAWH